jgi:DNA-binding transcriptional regulator YiaG
MKVQYRPFNVVIPTTDGESIAYEVPVSVPTIWDEEAQDFILTPGAHDIIERVKSRHMGVLIPEQLRELRAKLGNLSQKAMGELFQVGEKSWCRWESGGQHPSRSVNLLLKAVYDGELSVEYLENQRKPIESWSIESVLTHQLPERGFMRMDEAMDCDVSADLFFAVNQKLAEAA